MEVFQPNFANEVPDFHFPRPKISEKLKNFQYEKYSLEMLLKYGSRPCQLHQEIKILEGPCLQINHVNMVLDLTSFTKIPIISEGSCLKQSNIYGTRPCQLHQDTNILEGPCLNKNAICIRPCLLHQDTSILKGSYLDKQSVDEFPLCRE